MRNVIYVNWYFFFLIKYVIFYVCNKILDNNYVYCKMFKMKVKNVNKNFES